ncbi:SpaH/EbpB family LPXTG-anchored major pilin [Bifidobacterium oedipodis]|uniref:Fimbrial isopeptide formation D2 domain-containing protein n=1 Tax=Bifidobacterium oedipodis TaxID=2675322 RepID=A0A7Y0EP61_9BIFI|nr:SpaH/EbpB family LPXTG-anchored major pilin [Bifidobacterium sp. DSM 109957]NMM93849.1 fimbrial isopeptide formation D2 domain-containing protein [Bifidobacterium sp. DSM 109957]
MRRIWKTLVGILAAIAMLLTGGVITASAYADEPAGIAEKTGTGSIVVNPANSGQKYDAYRIFGVASYTGNGDDKKVAYTIAEDSPWFGFVTGNGAGTSYVEVSVKGNPRVVTPKESFTGDAAAKNFADAAITYMDQYNTEHADSQITPDQSATAGATDTSVTISGLDLGYYLVTSTTGSLVMLDTAAETVTIKDKNKVPEVLKKVQEGNIWDSENDAKIGDTVNFRTTITAQAGATNYVLHDKLSDGLTFGTVTKIEKISGDTTTELTKDTDYQVLTGENAQSYAPNGTTTEEKDTFTVTFSEAVLKELKAGDQLVVSYTATVNEDAVIRGDGNPNKTYLDYGKKDYTSHTPESTTTTYVWDFDVFKYTLEDGDKTPLAGVKFKLTTDLESNSPIEFVEKTGTSIKSYRVAKADESGMIEFVTDSNGKFKLFGLDSGTYYLWETEPLQGYNKLTSPITVEIKGTAHNGAVHVDGSVTAVTNNTVEVENTSGSELPETGGMGTTILYVVGAAVVVFAGLGLAVTLRKRQSRR